jgi:hypothetical protein
MTYRFSKWLAYSRFAAALVMAIALYIGTKPMFWGWLLFAPLFLYIVYEGARSYSYSITIDDDVITVSGFKRAQYRISEIAAINVWLAKGERIAVITFADRSKFSFPSHLVGFEELVGLLRKRTNLEKPASET